MTIPAETTTVPSSGARALFDYPARAAFEKVVPKSKIYDHAKPGRRVQQAFTSQVLRIVWQYKLAPETIRLPAAGGVEEIQVFRLVLKEGVGEAFSHDVLRSIDKAIGFPILFEIVAGDKLLVAAAYKRRSDADAKQWVLGEYFYSGWGPSDAERIGLPVAVDLAGLYRELLRSLIPLPPRPGETLREHAERVARIVALEREAGTLKAKLNREKQFNRKVEVNQELRAIRSRLEALQVATTLADNEPN